MHKNMPEVWRVLDDYKFTYGGEELCLSVGQYTNERLAIQVFCDDGPDCRITCHLPNKDIGLNQFWVKVGGREEELAIHLKSLGLIENLLESASIGYVRHYAELWQIKKQAERETDMTKEKLTTEQLREQVGEENWQNVRFLRDTINNMFPVIPPLLDAILRLVQEEQVPPIHELEELRKLLHAKIPNYATATAVLVMAAWSLHCATWDRRYGDEKEVRVTWDFMSRMVTAKRIEMSSKEEARLK